MTLKVEIVRDEAEPKTYPMCRMKEDSFAIRVGGDCDGALLYKDAYRGSVSAIGWFHTYDPGCNAPVRSLDARDEIRIREV